MNRRSNAFVSSFRWIAILLLFPPASRAFAAPATAPSELLSGLTSAYLDAKWDEVAQTLTAKSKELAALTDPKEKADYLYLRQTMAECRPAWWAMCKAGKRVAFKPIIWGRSLDAVYEPGAMATMKMQVTSFQTTATLTWPIADMDNTVNAEHGFTKGDLCDLNIWTCLGSGDAYSIVPISAQAQMDDAARMVVAFYANFRGNLTGAYYGTPRARRWDLWLDLAAHADKSGKLKDIMVRRIVGSAFMAELLSHPEKYPSIHLPTTLKPGSQEEQLAVSLKPWIEKHGWTLAEDRSMRDAFKALGTTNVKDPWSSGIVKLANGQSAALDVEKDGEFQIKRDAWVGAAFEKARGK